MDEDTHTGQVFNNTVDIREKMDPEYAGSHNFEATALRVRGWYDGSMRNVQIYDNSFIAHAGDTADYTYGAYGACINYIDSGNSYGDLNIIIENNTFQGIVETTDTDYYARQISLSQVKAHNTGIKFINNNMISDDTLSIAPRR